MLFTTKPQRVLWLLFPFGTSFSFPGTEICPGFTEVKRENSEAAGIAVGLGATCEPADE